VTWESFDPAFVELMTGFLAKVAKSFVMIHLAPDGRILDANAAFQELFPLWADQDGRSWTSLLALVEEAKEEALPLKLQTYQVLGGVVPGVRLRGIRIPEGTDSVFIGERVLPPSLEALQLITSTTNEMARLNRELRRKFRETEREKLSLDSRYHQLYESMAQGVVWVDPDGRILEANPSAHLILELRGGSGPGNTFEHLLSTCLREDGTPLPEAEHPVHQAFQSNRPHLGTILGLAGGATWILLDAIPLGRPGGLPPTEVFATFTDITERKHLLTALDATYDRLRKVMAAIDQASHAFVMTDLTGGIEYVNPAFCRLFGFGEDEIVGQPLGLLRPDRDELIIQNELGDRLSQSEAWSGQQRARRKDGSHFWVHATSTPVRDSMGEVLSHVLVLEDITETLASQDRQRLLESQLQQAQKMDSMGSLAGGVAHDMNNVLCAIQALATVQCVHAPPGTSLRLSLDTIVNACQRGGSLVKGLLGFARKHLEEVKDLDLNGIIREQAALLDRTTFQRIRLTLDLEGKLLPTRGDPASLSHALMNLCVNAVDAMPLGGDLTLRTRNLEPDQVSLEVLDTGSGMPREVMAKAFEPFFTTKAEGKGTGLGLAIVYSTVKSHGGRLNLESEPGRGTRVQITLPAQPEALEGPPEPRPSITAGSPLRVLMIDDDELLQVTWDQIMKALGHAATVVGSGEQALALLASGLKIDVVFLDWNMPGWGGAGTLPRLRAHHPDLPVIIATGGNDPEVERLALQDPQLSRISKPFTMDELTTALGRVTVGLGRP